MKMPTKAALVAISVAAVSAQAYAAVPEVVNAELWNRDDRMGVSTDVATVRAGKTDFEVVNDPTTLVHEMLVIKVGDYGDALPCNDKDDRIIEDESLDFGEVSELEPGQSGNLTETLNPGNTC